MASYQDKQKILAQLKLLDKATATLQHVTQITQYPWGGEHDRIAVKECTFSLLSRNQESFLETIAAKHGGRIGPCDRQWGPNNRAYRCRTCQLLSVTSICEDCFYAGGHQNHDYVMYHSESGGTCDCGTPSCMKEEGFCPKHNAATSAEIASTVLPDDDEDISWMIGVVKELLKDVSKGTILKPTLAAIEAISAHFFTRRILCTVLLEKPSVISVLMEINIRAFCDPMLTSFLVAIMLDPKIKPLVGAALVESYHLLELLFQESVSKEDLQSTSHEHLRISVQVFACHGLAPDVTWHKTVFAKVLKVIETCIKKAAKPRPGKIEDATPSYLSHVVDQEHQLIKNDAYWIMTVDFRDFLNASTGETRTLVLEDEEHLSLWIQCLLMMEFCNLHLRQTGDHVENDHPTWFDAYRLDSAIATLPFVTLIEWTEALEDMDTRCSVCQRIDSVARPLLMNLLSDPNNTEFMQLNNWFSYNVPCHRLIGLAWSQMLKIGKLQELLQLPNILCDMQRLMVAVIQIFAVRAQVRVGGWRRNGRMVEEQLWLYAHMPDADMHLDLDLAMLQAMCQVAAAANDDNGAHTKILWELQRRFGWETWVDSRDSHDVRKAHTGAVEDLMLLLISLVCEDTHLGGTLEQFVRKEMIAHLASASSTRSKLIEHVGSQRLEDESETLYDKVLTDVATFIPPDPTGLRQGEYALQQACWSEFDPAHLALRSHSRQTLENAVSNYWAANGSKEKRPPFLHPTSTKTLSFLLNKNVVDMLHRTFYVALKEPEYGFSPFLVFTVLHLYDMMSTEEDADDVLIACALQPLSQAQERWSLMDMFYIAMKHKELQTSAPYISSIVTKFRRHPDVDKYWTDCCERCDDAMELSPQKQKVSTAKAKRKSRKEALMARFRKRQKDVAMSYNMDMDESENKASTAKVCAICKGTEAEDMLSVYRCEWHIDCSPKVAPRLLTTTCGHCIHRSCLTEYLKSVATQVMESVNHKVLSREEFLCPTCRRICNIGIPIVGFPDIRYQDVELPRANEDQFIAWCREHESTNDYADFKEHVLLRRRRPWENLWQWFGKQLHMLEKPFRKELHEITMIGELSLQTDFLGDSESLTRFPADMIRCDVEKGLTQPSDVAAHFLKAMWACPQNAVVLNLLCKMLLCRFSDHEDDEDNTVHSIANLTDPLEFLLGLVLSSDFKTLSPVLPSVILFLHNIAIFQTCLHAAGRDRMKYYNVVYKATLVKGVPAKFTDNYGNEWTFIWEDSSFIARTPGDTEMKPLLLRWTWMCDGKLGKSLNWMQPGEDLFVLDIMDAMRDNGMDDVACELLQCGFTQGTDQIPSEIMDMLDFYRFGVEPLVFHQHCGWSDSPVMDMDGLVEQFNQASTNFLSSALMIVNVVRPTSLDLSIAREYHQKCFALGLCSREDDVSPTWLFKQRGELFKTSLTHFTLETRDDFPESRLPPLSATRKPLVDLPAQFNELVKECFLNGSCIACESKDVISKCLVCGVLHCKECQSFRHNTQVQLMLNTSAVTIRHSSGSWSIWGSPYLDDYFEEDLHLKRGRRLTLNTERYDLLKQQYANQTFLDTCRIWREETL